MIIDGTPITIGTTTPATATAVAAAVDIADNSQRRNCYGACAPRIGVACAFAADHGAAASTVTISDTGFEGVKVAAGGITYYYVVTSLRGPEESTLSTEASAKPK
jgi:hypothetical protein